MVTELHNALTNAGIADRLVMVGHSFGGPQVELYASMYAEDVAGVVLVDAAPVDLCLRLPQWPGLIAQKAAFYRTLATLESLGFLAFTPSSIPTRGLPDDAAAAYRAIAVSTDYFRTAVAENEAFQDNLADVREAAVNLGSTPLVVISRGYWDPIPGLSVSENEQAWSTCQVMQSELTRLSTNSRRIVATKSEHHIQLQQPELVVNAIRDIAEQVGE